MEPPRIAFVFPGEGSHRAGMAAAWRGDPAATAFDDVSRATGLDLVRLADEAECCKATAIGQPAVFAASLAAWRALRAAGVQPDVVAGHSAGEITAAVAAGSLAVDEAALLVLERAHAMHDAAVSYPGEMVAVLGLDDEGLRSLRTQLRADVVIADDNASGQVVLAGPTTGVEQAVDVATRAGAHIERPPLEGPFHTAVMSPALVRVSMQLGRTAIADPRVPLVTATTGTALTTAPAIRRALTDGLLSTVNWRAVQRELSALDVDVVVEVGPGGVLRALAELSMPGVDAYGVDRPSAVAVLVERLRTGRRPQVDGDAEPYPPVAAG